MPRYARGTLEHALYRDLQRMAREEGRSVMLALKQDRKIQWVSLSERERAIIKELIHNHFHMIGDNLCASFFVDAEDVTIREWLQLSDKVR